MRRGRGRECGLWMKDVKMQGQGLRIQDTGWGCGWVDEGHEGVGVEAVE